MKIAIQGAGCVGSAIASELYSSGSTVTLVATGERAARLSEKGINVNGKNYKLKIEDGKEKPELVILSVKNYDLERACEELRTVIDKKTIILPLLNSISPTPTIQQIFPENRVLYGYIQKIDAHRVQNGFAYNIAGEMHFGYGKNKEIAPELDEISKAFEKSAIKTFIDEDMVRGIWKKWMLNVGANQVSALTEANYLQFAQIPEISHVLQLAMQELLTIACFEGVDLGTKDIFDIIQYLTTYPYPKQTSMLQDVAAHRRTEVDYISGDIIRLSKKWNCACPVNLTMYYLIKSKEAAYLM